MTIDTEKFKRALLAEKETLEKELGTISRRNPENQKDWEAVPSTEERPSERDEVADKLESFEENIAIVRQLEARYTEVQDALNRIETGTYGLCSICEKPIEEARLDANPSATTCKEHLSQTRIL